MEKRMTRKELIKRVSKLEYVVTGNFEVLLDELNNTSYVRGYTGYLGTKGIPVNELLKLICDYLKVDIIKTQGVAIEKKEEK